MKKYGNNEIEGKFTFFRNISKSEMIEKDAIAVGMKTASEAIMNIRTVASLSKFEQ